MALTTKTGITASEIRNDYLFGTVGALIEPAKLTDAYLTNKIRGQEDGIERELGILWNETRIRSEPDPTDTDFDLTEPAYDYDSDFFTGERWGFIKVRHYPIRSVERFVFAYPNVDAKTFLVPKSWIRFDAAYGYIRLVPDGLSIMTNFSGYILSVLSGGRGIPHTILIDYTAGFQTGKKTVADSLRSSHQDLLEHLKHSVVVDIIRDGLLPGSSSINADGLSESISLEFQSIMDQQHAQRKVFKDKIKGIVMTVMV